MFSLKNCTVTSNEKRLLQLICMELKLSKKMLVSSTESETSEEFDKIVEFEHFKGNLREIAMRLFKNKSFNSASEIIDSFENDFKPWFFQQRSYNQQTLDELANKLFEMIKAYHKELKMLRWFLVVENNLTIMYVECEDNKGNNFCPSLIL